MECQECHQRPATLHFTHVINGNKTEVHLCEVCAKEKGYMTYPEEGNSLHNLLSGLFNFDTSQLENYQGKEMEQEKELACPKCNMTFSEFKRIGKFGCATCYETFSSRLDPIFRRIHAGNTKHDGKIPKRQGGDLHTKKQLEDYQGKLQHLVETEEFEEAAKVRDKINALKKQTRDPETGDNA